MNLMMTAGRRAAALDAVPKQLFIAGRGVTGPRRHRRGRGPVAGQTIAEVADATPQDGLDALAAAHDAWNGDWRWSAPRDGAEILRRATSSSPSVRRSRPADDPGDGQAAGGVRGRGRLRRELLRWYAEEAVRLDGRFTMHEAGPSHGRLLTMREPSGRACSSTPWSFARDGHRKLGPAIAAGSRWSSSRPARRCRCSSSAPSYQAGRPAGALNIITARSSGAVMDR